MTKKPERPGATGARVLRTRVKKKSGLKESSRRWLERHLNDPYVQRSKADGYRSRAAYKLIEIDDKHHLLKPSMRVIVSAARNTISQAWSKPIVCLVAAR